MAQGSVPGNAYAQLNLGPNLAQALQRILLMKGILYHISCLRFPEHCGPRGAQIPSPTLDQHSGCLMPFECGLLCAAENWFILPKSIVDKNGT